MCVCVCVCVRTRALAYYAPFSLSLSHTHTHTHIYIYIYIYIYENGAWFKMSPEWLLGNLILSLEKIMWNLSCAQLACRLSFAQIWASHLWWPPLSARSPPSCLTLAAVSPPNDVIALLMLEIMHVSEVQGWASEGLVYGTLSEQ